VQKAFVDRPRRYATWTNWCSFFRLFWFQCDFSKRSCGWVLVWPQTEGHHAFASKSAISALRAWKVSVRHSTSRFCKTAYGRLLRDICIILIAVITVEPADKISFVYNCMHTRLRGQYNGKWSISLVYVSRPLVTVITAICLFYKVTQ